MTCLPVIKATSGWVQNGGKYLVYTDDRPNEKFCQYASVGDSYEHHSRFLKGNKRYSSLFKLSPDDYKGWTNGLQNSGYASNRKYVSSLQSIIEKNNLQKYDQMVRPVWTSTRTNKEKNSRLRTTTAKLCLRWQSSKAKRVSRFSSRLSPLWTRKQGRKSNTMTTVWCPRSDARSIS